MPDTDVTNQSDSNDARTPSGAVPDDSAVNLVAVRRALISVSDKTDLVPFARGLHELGVELISTGGTARALSEAGLPVRSVEDVTGFPEMMDGRVKTLHPAIHGALLARRDVPAHRAAMEAHNITPIDLVCVNLYPFERTVRSADATPEQIIEQIDIGGPAVLRSAAKNHRFVCVVTAAQQYDRIINELRTHDGATTLELRRHMASAAFTRTAEYDTEISAWMSSQARQRFPEMMRTTYAKMNDLRYGENPHQRAAVYVDPTATSPGIASATVLHGKQLSYNNLNDGAAALELVQDLGETFEDQVCCTLVKHANPCGSAVADTAPLAFERAYAGDPMAAYGGILAISTTINGETAKVICAGKKFLEVIIAPGYDEDAFAMLSERWANVRLLCTPIQAPGQQTRMDHRTLPGGGLLVQEPDRHPTNPRNWDHTAGPLPDAAALRSASFAWTVSKSLKSNAIAIAADGQLLGGGPGQVDRVGSARIAVDKAAGRIATMREAGHAVIAASDAFFPFADGPKLLIDAGVTCLVHPGGSKRDHETTELCAEHNVSCLLTGIRHFKH